MLPPREGIYNGVPAQVSISETGFNRLATCIIEFKLLEEFQQSGEWADCSSENWFITGYFYLEKKDRSLNLQTIEMLKAALAWDGLDPFWLEQADFSNHIVRVKVVAVTYEGKTRLRVQYIRPYNAEVSTLPKADIETKQRIKIRLLPLLRAVQPTSPKPIENKKEVKPVENKKEVYTADRAWEVFCECTPNMNDEQRKKEWFRIMKELIPGKHYSAFSSEDWEKIATSGPSLVVPF